MRFLVAFLIVIGWGGVLSAPAQMRDPVVGRSGTHAVYGDIKVEGERANSKPVKLDLILYAEGRTLIARDTVSSNGRFRFNNISSGLYELVVEVEGQEITRFRVDLRSPLVDDVRQDLAFELKSTDSSSAKASAISAADHYERNSANGAALMKAAAAIDAKRYDEGADLLKKIVASDPKDFEAWTELGNVHLLQGKYADAENEYLRAIDLRPTFFLALLNLGRAELAQEKFEVAIDVLARAVKLRPDSADANYFLGESYLQVRKGSLAVTYLTEALRLEPKRMAEAHLRLALLYHAAGMKDKAAAEYKAFLKQRPDYKDRKKLEEYISENEKH